MKAPLLPIRGKAESSALLDRGGRPTLREFLSGLEFDPTTGTLRLNGTRVTLQLAEADRILRRELIRRLGEDEARIVLLRRGFRMGRNDAGFVAASWPMLDRGDAFTAGTRLHMFSGIVRVETVHNDFDFARGRFSAEFLWHNSLEAGEADGPTGTADRPACWQQLGYASGYASHFFGALVVYKETACAAQGHRACRVVGKLAEGWGEDDPDVILFRTRILPVSGEEAARPNEPTGADLAPRGAARSVAAAARLGTTAPGAPAPAPPEDRDAVLLRPMLAGLDRAARLALPLLIAGPGQCGQEAAVRRLLALIGADPGQIRLLDAASLSTAPQMREALDARHPAQTARRSTPPTQVLRIDGVEALTPFAQTALTDWLRRIAFDAPAGSGQRLILTTNQPLAALTDRIAPALLARLAPLTLNLPGLTQRDDLALVAQERLRLLATGLGLPLPADAADLLTALPPLPDLDHLDGILTRILLAAEGGEALTPALLAPLLAPQPAEDAEDAWITARLAAGDFSLPAHEARVRAAALAQTGGNLAAAARLLGISRPQLAYREQAGRE